MTTSEHDREEYVPPVSSHDERQLELPFDDGE